MYYITDFKTKNSIYKEQSQIRIIKKQIVEKNEIVLQAPTEYTKIISTKDTTATVYINLHIYIILD